MGALLAVTRDRERMVYFVTGHGERSPDDGDRKTGLSVAKSTLEDDQFVVRTLPLMQHRVRPDRRDGRRDGRPAQGLPAGRAHPARRLSAPRRQPAAAPRSRRPRRRSPPSRRVSAFTTPEQVVVDPERRLAGGEGVTVMVSDMLPSFLVSGTLEAPPVFSYARPLRVAGAELAGSVDQLSQDERRPATPSPRPTSAPMRRTSPKAALVVGAAVVPIEERNGRVIVVGDSDFVDQRHHRLPRQQGPPGEQHQLAGARRVAAVGARPVEGGRPRAVLRDRRPKARGRSGSRPCCSRPSSSRPARSSFCGDDAR